MEAMMKFEIDQWEELSARAHLLARVETHYRNYVSSMWRDAKYRSQHLLGDLWPTDTREIEALYDEHVKLELGFCRECGGSEGDEYREELEDRHALLEAELVTYLFVSLEQVRDPRQGYYVLCWSQARLRRHRQMRRQTQQIITGASMPGSPEELFRCATSIFPQVVPQFV